MRIIRYQNSQGQIHYGAQQPDGSVRQITGDIFGSFEVSKQPADIKHLKAPIAPTNILCIGLNYRQHAKESGAIQGNRPAVWKVAVVSAIPCRR